VTGVRGGLAVIGDVPGHRVPEGAVGNRKGKERRGDDQRDCAEKRNDESVRRRLTDS
jgi:hypothetical protein